MYVGIYLPVVPTVYLGILIDGQEINPGTPSTTYILNGTGASLQVIMCVTRGPSELTSPVVPTLNWMIDLVDNSTAPFNSISGVVPPTTYIVSTSTGNVSVDVIVGSSAAVGFVPSFTRELQGRYRCTGNSSTEGVVSQEVNLVSGE